MEKEQKYSKQEIREHIFYLHTYHKYRLPDGSKNPAFNRLSGLILDLKNPGHPNHTKAVQIFGKRLADFLPKFIDNDEEVYVAIVPSHEKGKVSDGLRGVIRHVKQVFNIRNSANPLIRHTTIPKLSSGGNRSRETHLWSIRVDANFLKPKCKVILLDDVTTTNNSLCACEDLLYEVGAGLVICIALAQTKEL